MSALRLLHEENITSSVTQVNIENVFTTEYTTYKVTANGLSTDGTTHGTIGGRLLQGSVAATDSVHDFAFAFLAPNTSFTDERTENGSSFSNMFAYFTDQAPETQFASFYIHNPAKASCYTFIHGNSGSAYSGIQRYQKYMAAYTVTKAFDGIQLNMGASVSSGQIMVYGYRENTI